MLLIQWEAASKRAATLQPHTVKVQAHPWIKKVVHKYFVNLLLRKDHKDICQSGIH